MIDLILLEQRYKDAIRPSNLIRNIESFSEWLQLATCKKDLECALKAFEDDGLYEHCIIIKKAIDSFEEKARGIL